LAFGFARFGFGLALAGLSGARFGFGLALRRRDDAVAEMQPSASARLPRKKS
jgi:hypothetical protein